MTNKINVLHLINSFEIGGLEKLLYYFVKNLDFFKFNPIIGALNKRGPLKKEFESLGIPVFDFGLRPGVDLRVVPRISRVMKAQCVDILHTHNLGPHFYGSLAAIISGVSFKVHTQHGISDNLSGSNILKHRYLDRKTDFVVAVSPHVETHLRVKWKPRCNVLTILNGIEVEDTDDMTKTSDEYRQMIGAEARDQIVGHVARMSQVKDQFMLLRAFSILYKKHKNCRLVILGDGPMNQSLVKQARSLGIAHRVHFMGERNDVRGFLSVFDVFVLSSVSEGISIALLEAMAQGAVPIVTEVGGNCIVVKDGVNGLLSPPGNENRFAENIRIILESCELRKRLAINAKKTIEEKFSIQKMVENYQQNIYLQYK